MCARFLHTTSRMSRVLHKSDRGCLFLVLREIEQASRKMKIMVLFFNTLSLSLKSRWFASEAIDTPCYMHACHNSNNNLAAYLDLVFLSTPWLYRQKLSHSPGQRIVTSMEKQSIISIMQLAIWVSLPCWSCFYTKGHGSSTPNNIPLQKKGNFRPHPTCPH